MAITLRNDAKNQIIDILNKQGYPSYSKLVSLFDIYLTDDPTVIGYMMPGQAKIVLNKQLTTDQVSTIVRHEILHEYFSHAPRAAKWIREHPKSLGLPELVNIAADYDISNKGYTDNDKSIIRSIQLGDKMLRGLVTEDDHPEWVNLSFEDMYEKLTQQLEKDVEKIRKEMEKSQNVSKKDISDLQDDIEEEQGEQGQQGQQGPRSQQGPRGQKGQSSQTGQNGQSGEQGQQNAEAGGSGEGNSENDLDGKMQGGNSQDNASSSNKNENNVSQEEKSYNKKLDKLSDKLDDLEDELDDAETDGDEPFDSPKESTRKTTIAKKVKAIRDAFNDAKIKHQIEQEATEAKIKEKQVKEIKNVERVKKSGIFKFKLSLNKFIANQIEEQEDETYARENPAYADTEFILPGKMIKDTKYIPIINVYWDVSGSFQDPAKTQSARNAIATLNTYVSAGDIEIHTYYFAEIISSTKSGAGSGTTAYPVVEHIKETKPDNVIIITDSDTDGEQLPSVTVPGAVWMLFYDGRSHALMDAVKGKKENKYFDIEY